MKPSKYYMYYCGDVRSRTSYNFCTEHLAIPCEIVVTFDLGRVTTSVKTLHKVGFELW